MPQNAILKPQGAERLGPDKEHLPKLEREVCLDLTKHTISVPSDISQDSYQKDNPFKGKIYSSPVQFYISRNQDIKFESTYFSANEKDILKIDKTELFTKLQSLSPEQLNNLTSNENAFLMSEAREIQNNIFKIPKKDALTAIQAQEYLTLQNRCVEFIQNLAKFTPIVQETKLPSEIALGEKINIRADERENLAKVKYGINSGSDTTKSSNLSKEEIKIDETSISPKLESLSAKVKDILDPVKNIALPKIEKPDEQETLGLITPPSTLNRKFDTEKNQIIQKP